MSNTNKPKAISRNPVIKFNKLAMFFGEPYVIDLENCEGSITIVPPMMLDIIHVGYEKFFTTLNIFTTNTTSYRLPLWKAGIDWNNYSDFNLFMMLYSGIDHDVSKLMFGDLDFSKFKPYKKSLGETEATVLYNAEDKVEIDEQVYFHISQYLRAAFKNNPEEKITKDRNLKLMYITKDEKHIEAESKKKEGEQQSSEDYFLSLISACLNHPGFKYNLEELKQVNICQFMDSVSRLQIYEQTNAILKGMYSGLALGGAKDLSPDDYNFMRAI